MDIKEIKGETTYTLTLTGKQLRMLRYFADTSPAGRATDSFLTKTDNTEAASLDVDFNTRF